jgi:hypothetical protein
VRIFGLYRWINILETRVTDTYPSPTIGGRKDTLEKNLINILPEVLNLREDSVDSTFFQWSHPSPAKFTVVNFLFFQ